MGFTAQLLFFFGAIGVFNSLLLSLNFLFNPKLSTRPNRLFGGFLLIVSLRIIKSVFYSFSSEEPIAFLQSGPSFFLLIGPLLFSYIKSCIAPEHFAAKRWKLILYFWIFIVLSLLLFLPFPKNVTANKEVLLPLINAQWLVYLLCSFYALRASIFEFSKATRTSRWLLSLVVATLVTWSAFFFVSFPYFISGSIVFSLLFYAFCIYFFFHKKAAADIFKRNKEDPSIVDQREMDQLVQQLVHIMEAEKPYLNPALKSADLAELLGISTHEFSRLTNQYLGKTFSDLINEYRVLEAKELLAVNSNYTLEAIGNQAGFNSKSAFYKAFKKFQGTTPGQFKV